jgi:hypothetical protein
MTQSSTTQRGSEQAVGRPVYRSVPERTNDKTAIRSLQVSVPEAELTELRERIEATRWADRETVPDATQGVQLATTQALAHIGRRNMTGARSRRS